MTFIPAGAKLRQITARLPDELVAQLDEAAAQLCRTRAEVMLQAVEYYLDDFEDISLAIEVLRDPADPVLDWEEVKRGLALKKQHRALVSIIGDESGTSGWEAALLKEQSLAKDWNRPEEDEAWFHLQPVR